MIAPITLTPELQAQIEREAVARGMSVPEFVRETLERAIRQPPAEDPLFADDAVHRDQGPTDLAAQHDDYLYDGDAA